MVATWYLRRIASSQSTCFSGLRVYIFKFTALEICFVRNMDFTIRKFELAFWMVSALNSLYRGIWDDWKEIFARIAEVYYTEDSLYREALQGSC